MLKQSVHGQSRFLIAGLWVSSLLLSGALAQSAPENQKPAATPPAPSATPSPHTRKTSPYRPAGLTRGAKNFYVVTWGVEPVAVKVVSSGLMVRFSYRVINAEKAKALNDKKENPYLLDERAHVKLVVPTLEKVGQLRQTGTLEDGKIYWMVFSNKGQFVKVGDRVSVVIGKFRVDGLVVE